MLFPALCLNFEQFGQPREAGAEPDVFYCHIHRLAAADEDKQFSRPGHAGVEQIALKHHVVLGKQRNYHRRKFASLRFVNGYCVGKCQLVGIIKGV